MRHLLITMLVAVLRVVDDALDSYEASQMSDVPEWQQKLKAAYTEGYYRTEAAEGEQSGWPWQNKTCKDCVFWGNSICQIYAEYRSSMAHTCHYIQPAFYQEGQSIIAKRRLGKTG